jgi:uncharacterized protein (DUF433 family)
MASKKPVFTTVGQGVYTITEAQRLTGVPRQRISRWTRGYSYEHRGRKHFLPPLIGGDGHTAEGYTITFADLIEIRFLNAFREYGVNAAALRIASRRAQELIGRPHPFSSYIFRTDGVTILAEISKDPGDRVLLDLIKNQYAFEKVVAPYLYTELDFNRLAEPERWWPLGRESSVVIDPQRCFGAPISVRSGIRTQILSRAFEAEQSAELVARLFRIDVKEVHDAVAFETKLAA